MDLETGVIEAGWPQGAGGAIGGVTRAGSVRAGAGAGSNAAVDRGRGGGAAAGRAWLQSHPG